MRADKKKIKGLILILLGFAAFCGYIWQASDPRQEEIADKILRFHILANSDSARDQEVKEKVRDEVGQYMAQYLKDAADLAQTREIVDAHMDGIVREADLVLEREGCAYRASARRAKVEFPIKTYGDYTFPAGEYEALEITLGEGAGHNWWCVLYPNMCFRGSVYEIVTEDAKEALREVLSPEEYAKVFSSGDYEIRFRFLEFFRGKQ